jgi:asparagine synthase (glutamine-hydrolysing)
MNTFMMSYWRRPEDVVVGASEPESVYRSNIRLGPSQSVPELMMVSDALQYLPDDILVKTDRASMAVSLEVRAPLLDFRLFELAWRLPLAFKRRDGRGKWPLRRLLAEDVPAALFERPKMGFGVPLESWLRSPLRDWAASLLDKKKLIDQGYFDAEVVRERWRMHREGRHNWAQPLWNVLAFQAWLEQQ